MKAQRFSPRVRVLWLWLLFLLIAAVGQAQTTPVTVTWETPAQTGVTHEILLDGAIAATVAPELSTATILLQDYASHVIGVRGKAMDPTTGMVLTGDVSSIVYQVCQQSAGQFRANYFRGTALAGYPYATDCPTAINFNWAQDGPFGQVDNFSVRFVKSWPVGAGTLNINATADDGVRVFVNGAIAIDGWVDQSATSYTGTAKTTTAPVDYVLEYYEKTGAASLVSSALFTPDPDPPVASPLTIICPAMMTIESPMGQPVPVTFTATVSGGTPPYASVMAMPMSGTAFPVGITRVTMSVTDAATPVAGLSSCQFSVVITFSPPLPPGSDTTLPTITAFGVARKNPTQYRITLRATDNVAVVRMDIRGNGTIWKTCTFPPGLSQRDISTGTWLCELQTNRLVMGSNLITADVSDAANNHAMSTLTVVR